MSSQSAIQVLSAVEFVLSAVLASLFWKKGLHRRFPAMGAYLAMRVAFNPVLTVLLIVRQSRPLERNPFMAYFFVYWAVYIAAGAAEIWTRDLPLGGSGLGHRHLRGIALCEPRLSDYSRSG